MTDLQIGADQHVLCAKLPAHANSKAFDYLIANVITSEDDRIKAAKAKDPNVHMFVFETSLEQDDDFSKVQFGLHYTAMKGKTAGP